MPQAVTYPFHQIRPGQKIPDDWYNGVVPANIVCGDHTVADSAFCFRNFFSTLPQALVTGHHVTFWRTSLAAEEHARIEIGDYCYLANASLVCSERISIGSFVFIAGGVTIADSDFHPLDPALRLADTIALSPIGNRSRRPSIRSLPVIIGDDVWIGFNATILKGVEIGAGAFIQPGAVVTENVAAGQIVGGNPARPIQVPK